MKKILLMLVLICTLFTTTIYASEVDMTKQEMMRDSTPPSSELVSIEEPIENDSKSLIAIILAVAIIMIVVGLLSTFVTRYALSIRNKNDTIYEQQQKMPEDSE